jgi:hypothetical protein
MDGIRKATLADVNSLAPRLGFGDLLEVYAMGMSPYQALKECLEQAEEAWVAVVNGAPQVMFGVAKGTELTDVYTPFLLGSSEMPALRFFKEVKAVLADWLPRYKELTGIVDSRNLRAQRWLQWAGFEFGESVAVGPFARPFRTIHMRYAVTDIARRPG